MVFRESRVVDEVWAGVAPRALAGEALLIVLDNFEHVPRSLERRRRTQKYARRDHPQAQQGDQRRPRRHQREVRCDLGSTAFLGSPADFNKFIAEETEKWAGVIKFAGIKAV